ncbi:hypothetical protein V5799_005426 [Amblyomma americanum]|uniref:Uncharacterized protein n=1 Tax=Amblyomma americanum TaxID=6943 RepID=A0AAQ4DZA3_AMBAM
MVISVPSGRVCAKKLKFRLPMRLLLMVACWGVFSTSTVALSTRVSNLFVQESFYNQIDKYGTQCGTISRKEVASVWLFGVSCACSQG